MQAKRHCSQLIADEEDLWTTCNDPHFYKKT